MTGRTTPIIGNFDMGECFADVQCIRGHPTRLLNIGRDHFVACDTCRTCVHVGSNLMSGWRQENESIWRQNEKRLVGYALLE
jgi:hypothetical protein